MHKLLLSEVLIVDLLCDVLQVLHVTLNHHLSQEAEVAMLLVFHCAAQREEREVEKEWHGKDNKDNRSTE